MGLDDQNLQQEINPDDLHSLLPLPPTEKKTKKKIKPCKICGKQKQNALCLHHMCQESSIVCQWMLQNLSFNTLGFLCMLTLIT